MHFWEQFHFQRHNIIFNITLIPILHIRSHFETIDELNNNKKRQELFSVCCRLLLSSQRLNFGSLFPLHISSTEKRLISLCVGCGNQIHDQYILRVSPDLEWHAACLKCAECSQYLDESCTCFVRDGKTYCKRDYIRYSTFCLSSTGLYYIQYIIEA